jgi:lipoprotein-anchoring transpeptidase ErfK/SrfK
LAAAVLAACGGGTRPNLTSPAGSPGSPTPSAAVPAPPPTTAAQMSLVARAKAAKVPVFDSPTAPAPKLTLDNPNRDGAPLVFLVKEDKGAWIHVLLPVRPNGSTGWIRAADVVEPLERDPYRVRVELGAHRITVWNGDQVFLQEPVGVGTGQAPTPGGDYYLTELLVSHQPEYGPYAYGISGFSEVYTTFAGGPGQLGLHGTNDPSGLGKNVSHGCIRMSNAGITKLAKVLPAGTPIQIVP